MTLPAPLRSLRLPVVCSPMFIASTPPLVIAQCMAGLVGSFPALNARPASQLADWLDEIDAALAAHRHAHPDAAIGPLAVNQVVHRTNARLEQDLRLCIERRVPIMISSLRAPDEIIDEVHRYGGLLFHDVISVRHAEKALEAGVDGLILVCAGAGGHSGSLSPFALLAEVRRFFDGPVVLAGAIATGGAILAAQAAGADLAYIGTSWLATREANVVDDYKRMLVASNAKDVILTDTFSGVPANYLRGSIERVGYDPAHLPPKRDGLDVLGEGNEGPKAWRDVWSAGHGVGMLEAVTSVAETADRLEREYRAALRRVQAL